MELGFFSSVSLWRGPFDCCHQASQQQLRVTELVLKSQKHQVPRKHQELKTDCGQQSSGKPPWAKLVPFPTPPLPKRFFWCLSWAFRWGRGWSSCFSTGGHESVSSEVPLNHHPETRLLKIRSKMSKEMMNIKLGQWFALEWGGVGGEVYRGRGGVFGSLTVL